MANDVTIRCNKELRDKLNLYLEIKNKDKKHNEPKIKQPDIINRLLSDFLKDKVLTNTFIEVDEPYYFNLSELHKKGKVTADKELITNNADEIAVINKKIPNNLDKFSEEYNTFCYGNTPGLHKGIYTLHNLKLDANNNFIINNDFLRFEYNTNKGTLNISLADGEALELYVSLEKKREILNEIKEFEEEIKKNGSEDIKPIFKSMEIISNYKLKKHLKKFVFEEEILKYLKENSTIDMTDPETLTGLEEWFNGIYEENKLLKDYKKSVEDMAAKTLDKIKQLEKLKLETEEKYGYSIDDFELIE